MTTQIENLETKVRQNIAIISEKFSYSESFSKKARDAYDQAG